MCENLVNISPLVVMKFNFTYFFHRDFPLSLPQLSRLLIQSHIQQVTDQLEHHYQQTAWQAALEVHRANVAIIRDGQLLTQCTLYLLAVTCANYVYARTAMLR